VAPAARREAVQRAQHEYGSEADTMDAVWSGPTCMWCRVVAELIRAPEQTEQSLNKDLPNTKNHDDPARAKALKNHRDNIANDAC
jgi:hypothetical protein